MKYKKTIACLAAIVLLLAGCAPPNTAPVILPQEQSDATTPQQGQPPAPMTTLRVPYDSASTLNPYTATAAPNYYLSTLLYDSLVRLDTTYNPQNLAATAIVLEGQTCTITLKEGLRFWDDTPLTPQDVLYSLSQAMQSPYYNVGLTGVQQAYAPEDVPNTIVITLQQADRFFVNSLCFPIIKTDTIPENPPMGSGKYKPDLASNRFVQNQGYHGVKGGIQTIELVNITDYDAMAYSVKAGAVDYVFSDMRQSLSRQLGNSYVQVPLNNLVYLGLNANRQPFSSAALRQTIYGAINRQLIVDGVYEGFAVSATMPFNPTYSVFPYQVVPRGATAAEIATQLEQAGYTTVDEQGYRIDASGRRLTLTMVLVQGNTYRDNLARQITQQLGQIGIEVIATKYSYQQYISALANGGYDLYIAEVRLPYNMDISMLLTPGSSTGYGVQYSAQLDAAYTAYLADTGQFAALEEAFVQHAPFVPLVFRRGMSLFSESFSANMVATEQDIFYNITEW